MKFKNDIEAQSNIILDGALADAGGSPGTVNQLLSSTATGTAWIDPSTIVAEAATLVVIACKNTSGAAIAQGTPVYQTGTVGATATIEIAPADALISANKLPAIGLLQTALNNNGLGFVVITGELTNFTTSPIDGVVPTTGDKVFVKSGGGLTLTKPTGEGNGIQNMGLVGKVSSGNSGSITVSSIMRTNDVPNLPEGRIWVGDGNTIVSDTVYIDEPNERMGIGTTSPGDKLHVSGGAIRLDNFYQLRWGGTGTGIYGHSSQGLNFFTDSGTTRLKIEDGGNVGINTTSPLSKFQVNGQASVLGNSFNGLAYFNGTNALASYNTANKIVMSSNGSADGLYTGGLHLTRRALTQQGHFGSGIRGISVGTVLQDNALELYTSTNTEQNATRLKIASNGNVGIGTTAPSQLLHVAGSMRLQNQLYDSTNSIGTSGQVLTKTSAGTIWADNRGLAPTTPGGIVATIVGETIEIAFNQSTTSNIDYYQVWSSDDGGDYGIIGQIAPSDFSSTMTVVDTTFVTGGTMSYRVYAVKSGVYSPAGTVSKAYTVSALSVTNMTVVNLNTAYYIQYEKPLSRFIDHVEIYMDSQTTSAALNRSNASIVYSGQNASYMRNVGTNNNFHQFWVEIVTS
jgi:hypothetical protein